MRILLMTALLAATAHAGEPTRVTLVVVGAEAARIEASMVSMSSMSSMSSSGAGAQLPIELVVGHLPRPAAPERDVSSLLAGARQRYVNGDFAACLDSLGEDGLVTGLLASGRRELAARVMLWQIACRVGRGALSAATELARQFAAFSLEVPADVATATPDVELLLTRAIQEAAGGKRARLTVDAPPLRARVSLDGRTGVCVTPCVLAVLPGDHILALDADGYLPAARRVPVTEAGSEVKLDVSLASPEIAAQQWNARYAGSALLYSEASTRLLAMAIASRRLVLVNAEGARDLRLRGTLATDGTVRAQSERTATLSHLESESRRLLRDLLINGKVLEPARPIYKRAAFWVPLTLAVSAAVVAASIAASLNPNVHTRVGF